MNEAERTGEHRKWRLWELIGGFLSVFHFRPWRDLTMGRKILPRLSDEPPLVTLDKLAMGELPPEVPTPITDPEAAANMMDIFREVAQKDAITADSERRLVSEFLLTHRSAKWEEADIEGLLTRFSEGTAEPVSLRNACYIVKNRASEYLRRSFLTTLFRLGYQDGMTPSERQTVDRIGEWLDLSHSTIRQISLSTCKD